MSSAAKAVDPHSPAAAPAEADAVDAGHDDHVEAEDDVPSIFPIVAGIIAVVIAIIVSVAVVYQYFGIYVRGEIARKVLTHESSQLRELRATEQQKLSHYQWVDKNAGVLRIPLDRAKELTLRDWKSRPTTLAPAPEPEPAPAASAVGSPATNPAVPATSGVAASPASSAPIAAPAASAAASAHASPPAPGKKK